MDKIYILNVMLLLRTYLTYLARFTLISNVWAQNTHCKGKYHKNISIFTHFVDFCTVKLETRNTVILPPTVSVFCFGVNSNLTKVSDEHEK